MRLLLLNYEFPPKGGGAAKATLALAQSLTRLGHQVTIWCGGEKDHKYELEGIQIWQIKIPWSGDRKASMRTFAIFVLRSLWPPRSFRKCHFDHCVCFFLFPCGPIALFWSLCRKLPFSIALRGGDVPGTEPSLNVMHWFLTPIRKWITKRAAFVFANSVGLAQLAAKSCGPDIQIVPNGVRNHNIKKTYNFRGNIHLVFAGRFQYQKNLEDMLRGLRKHLSLKKVQLTMVGSGPCETHLKSMLKQWNVDGSVRWEGWLSPQEVLNTFAACDVFILFSHYEGMPNVLLEAASCGLPAIVSDVAGNQEVVLNEKTGWLIRKDPTALEEKIEELLSHPEKIEKLGQQAKKWVLEEFNWEKSAQELAKLMEK